MNLEGSFTVELPAGLQRASGSRRAAGLSEGRTEPPRSAETGRIPRISRLMALAIRMRRLVDEGVVRDYSDLARLGGVSIPRMTKIMRLVLLAPDIQEEILFLPRVVAGRDPVRERHMWAVAEAAGWVEQQRAWERLRRRAGAE
jgi:hypothetical protein